MSEIVQEVERVVIPAKAAQMLMAAFEASQAAQAEFARVLEVVRATLDVPEGWEARRMENGSVCFVGSLSAAEPIPTA